ncbi:MAG: hypothetical protein ABW252_11915 [Polyangiales bacterium]
MGARAWCLVVGLGLLGAVGCGGGGVLVQSPQTVGAARVPQQTEQAILEALPKRGWTAENVQPGRILAFLSVRAHLLRADIRYDATQVAIYYVDSDHLAARIEPDGRIYAHKKVNAWIQNLARDIASAINMAPLDQPVNLTPPVRDPSAGPNAPQVPAAAQPTAPVPTAPAQ